MVQINEGHLAFMDEAREAFSEDDVLETYLNEDDFELIALRYGEDRDCILVCNYGGEVANFVQQIKKVPRPSKIVMNFAHEMELVLRDNVFKNHHEKEHWCDLVSYFERTIKDLKNELMKPYQDKREITTYCAEIAVFTMMISDSYGTKP